MSNPCINRWGLNTFWHNFWFNDFDYAINLRQDKSLSILITTFIFYGVNLTYNIFSNKYWYLNLYKNLKSPTYYRWITYKPSGKEELAENYRIRQEADCIFPMKIWILKYGSWLIINQYWFNPFKGRRRPMRLSENPNHIDSLSLIPTSNLTNIRRLKTLLSKSFFLQLKKKLYYNF